MFPDTSTLNVGRNSNIVIDEYVYDPAAGTGKMVATVSKGVMRFVGGQISHTAGVTVKTPVATLGIRGGVATVVYPIPPGFTGSDPKLAQAQGEIVIGHVGSVVIKNNVGSVIVRPGYMTWVSGPNDPIPEPFPDSRLPAAEDHGRAKQWDRTDRRCVRSADRPDGRAARLRQDHRHRSGEAAGHRSARLLLDLRWRQLHREEQVAVEPDQSGQSAAAKYKSGLRKLQQRLRFGGRDCNSVTTGDGKL